MTKEPFLLVSLEENESKNLAQVISNNTARKVLDLLSKDESSTETDIAKKLKVPLSTVHYNLQALVKANLVQAEEFHYSEKGKEVLHYSLANKLIIIAPKKTSTESFKDKLKSIFPIGIITLVVAGVIQFLSMFKAGASKAFAAAPMTADYAARGAMGVAEKAVVPAAVPLAEEAGNLMMTAAGGAAGNFTENIAQNVTEPIVQPMVQIVQQAPPANIALWFLVGAAFVLILLTIWYWFVTRKKK